MPVGVFVYNKHTDTLHMIERDLSRTDYRVKVLLLLLFGAAMAYCEAAVVVYLRGLFYPEGFSFPLKLIPRSFIAVEVFRELATIVMLVTVATIVAKTFWERFGYFMILFGIWDIFYYVWLKTTIDWPSSLFDWDVLFLIPLPWIGPVMASLLVALSMFIMGLAITHLFAQGYSFKLTPLGLILSALGIIVIVLSFIWDTSATLHQQMPQPYHYSLLIVGLVLCLIAFMIAYRLSAKRGKNL